MEEKEGEGRVNTFKAEKVRGISPDKARKGVISVGISVCTFTR